MDEKELAAVRRENLRKWMDARDMTGSQLAEKIGSGRAYASLLFNPSRYFGEKAARHIEEKLRMPKGYLDATGRVAMASGDWGRPEDLDDEVFGAVKPVGIRISPSGELEAVATDLPPISFPKSWLIDRGVTERSNLRICKVSGSAMEPYLQAGDSVMIDVGQVGIRDGDVYAIRHGGDMRLRRLFITVDGGVQLRSDNPTHPSETLPCDAAAKLGVIGRVIWRAG